jgi:hypothetical protein
MATTPIPPYLFLTRPKFPIDRLRRMLIPVKWRQMQTWSRRAGFVGLVVGWPIIAAFKALGEVRRHGKVVRNHTGISEWRQWIDQYVKAVWWGIAPHGYYLYNLYDATATQRVGWYLDNMNSSALAGLIDQAPERGKATLNDKAAFASLCAKHGLPTPRTLGIFQHGRLIGGEAPDPNALPAADLFAKPKDMNRGQDVRSWRYLESNCYQGGNGQVMSAAEIFQELREASRRVSFLLQRRYVNHPVLEQLSGEVLCTTRVLTGRRPNGELSLLAAVLRMPTRHALADNFDKGGIACSIHERSGVLGTAAGMDHAIVRLTHHPVTGKPISGITLPFWDEVKRICLKAHGLFPEVTWVGWDAALTPDGPILVEGNYAPGLESLQKGGDVPFVESALYALCMEHLHSRGFDFSSSARVS